jgi:hypothetical protein
MAKAEPYRNFGSNGTSLYILKPTDLLPHLGQVLIMASVIMFSSFVLAAATLKGQWNESFLAYCDPHKEAKKDL